MGKFLSSNIFSNSDPTAPDEPKIATFKDLLGNSEELAKIMKIMELIKICFLLYQKR